MVLTFLLGFPALVPQEKNYLCTGVHLIIPLLTTLVQDSRILASSFFLLFIYLDFDSVVIKCKIFEGPLENSKRPRPMDNTDQPS